MKILITGACGFVGSTLAKGLREHFSGTNCEIFGIDNLSRPGSELNRGMLKTYGVRFFHGDLRLPSDLETIGPVDWVIDAAANPSVLAGLAGQASSRQLMEHNLLGTLNVLEYCKAARAGLILLSTSRVYSIEALSTVPVRSQGIAFRPALGGPPISALTDQGISEDFSTRAPISLYGATKLASEGLALEYSHTFGFPVWINRCGVLAGAGQFGRADQGIFSFWINSWLARQRLRYIGFGGNGHQVRDALHPLDLVPLLLKQMSCVQADQPRVVNVSGGLSNSMSLAELSAWCTDRLGAHTVESEPIDRQFDVPWLVLDSGLAQATWGWQPQTKLVEILDGIALHAQAHPGWLDISG